ncbi:type II toxin-antitoxin system VapC family toxin [Brevundimonas sp. VNH65]|uniref:type II toxin-antitoxin system VapC family toxin n=1 Tax=Brevundimonas sp. VNH65 TaxID=3400917 RepID=UPI003C11A6C9
MKIVTIDASAAASWIFPTQATHAGDAFLAASDAHRLIAPAILPWELGNQILNRSRKAGVSPAAMLDDLRALNVEIDAPPASEAVLTSVEAALSRRLSLFDNAYLQLCLDRSAALASRDAALLQAALVVGVEIIDLRD